MVNNQPVNSSNPQPQVNRNTIDASAVEVFLAEGRRREQAYIKIIVGTWVFVLVVLVAIKMG